MLKVNPNFEELDAEGHTGFHSVLAAALSADAPLNRDVLREYDENIVAHTRTINRKRERPIRWKYFQYLALLLTEIYLDLYFRDAEALLRELNVRIGTFNTDKDDQEQLPPYSPDDLRKVCFWMATGSGKTLIMQVNILQYLYYLRLQGKERALNKVLLITPNPGLSQQHLGNLHASGFSRAELLRKNTQSTLPLAEDTPIVEILHIQQLREEAGETTVAVEAFEGNNLVLVDEGHLGATGEDWMDKRDKLCATGFSFEYSATFGQAMATTTARGKGLDKKYAKSILLDYSYRFFYRDGYGKDYRILNLADDRDEEVRSLYLTACLLAFHQQLRLYKDLVETVRPFNIERPLWVFVGGSVQAVRTENKIQVSDVVDVLLFLAGFLANRASQLTRIERLLGGRPGLLDRQGNDMFAHAFPYLAASGLSPADMYGDILDTVFHASAPGKLRIDHLIGSEGELLLRVADHEAFGLINVGDAAALRKLCEERAEFDVREEAFRESYFGRIEESDSTIHLLIGSKKFTEGWDSWRVSTMGLMNIGRTEGPQVVQLFGRGVRLKGHGGNLKRSSAVPGLLRTPRHLALVETFNVFGVRADYMHQFRDYLEAEGMSVDGGIELVLPVVKTLGSARLKMVRLRDDLDYRRDAPKPILSAPTEAMKRHPLVLNWYPKLQVHQSRGAVTISEHRLEEGRLGREHLIFLDWDAISQQLVEYKRERGWHNLSIPLGVLPGLFADASWYKLYIPGDELDFQTFDKTRRWQAIVVALLKRFMDKYYTVRKDEWERKNGLEVVDLLPSDPNFVDEYRVLVEASMQDVVDKLTELKTLIESGLLRLFEYGNVHARRFDRHLYYPLLHASSSGVSVAPVHLNKGEWDFMVDLSRWYVEHLEFFHDKELYLLRNRSRRGIGFFEAGNYYPDFFLWLLADGYQHVAFLDPKGLLHVDGEDSPKIRFHRTIKEVEGTLEDPQLTLDAFVLSVTPYKAVQWWRGGLTKDEFAQRHVFFQPDDTDTYIGAILSTILASRPVNAP